MSYHINSYYVSSPSLLRWRNDAETKEQTEPKQNDINRGKPNKDLPIFQMEIDIQEGGSQSFGTFENWQRKLIW